MYLVSPSHHHEHFMNESWREMISSLSAFYTQIRVSAFSLPFSTIKNDYLFLSLSDGVLRVYGLCFWVVGCVDFFVDQASMNQNTATQCIPSPLYWKRLCIVLLCYSVHRHQNFLNFVTRYVTTVTAAVTTLTHRSPPQPHNAATMVSRQAVVVGVIGALSSSLQVLAQCKSVCVCIMSKRVVLECFSSGCCDCLRLFCWCCTIVCVLFCCGLESREREEKGKRCVVLLSLCRKEASAHNSTTPLNWWVATDCCTTLHHRIRHLMLQYGWCQIWSWPGYETWE